jgi:hypothetical protein
MDNIYKQKNQEIEKRNEGRAGGGVLIRRRKKQRYLPMTMGLVGTYVRTTRKVKLIEYQQERGERETGKEK